VLTKFAETHEGAFEGKLDALRNCGYSACASARTLDRSSHGRGISCSSATCPTLAREFDQRIDPEGNLNWMNLPESSRSEPKAGSDLALILATSSCHR
jgi:hypothetical protein